MISLEEFRKEMEEEGIVINLKLDGLAVMMYSEKRMIHLSVGDILISYSMTHYNADPDNFMKNQIRAHTNASGMVDSSRQGIDDYLQTLYRREGVISDQMSLGSDADQIKDFLIELGAMPDIFREEASAFYNCAHLGSGILHGITVGHEILESVSNDLYSNAVQKLRSSLEGYLHRLQEAGDISMEIYNRLVPEPKQLKIYPVDNNS
ncbi:hypothetical protein GF345_04445 [Candidatus Woesearchaeota archaeon]|nr:hypothetical protein [Candidatus Woesearchaeota archaeon]